MMYTVEFFMASTQEILLPYTHSMQYVDVGNNASICCYHWKKMDAQTSSPSLDTIVIVHGWLDHGSAWNSVARYLLEYGYDVVAIDNRGHGRSFHIADHDSYHFSDYLSDLHSVLTQLQLAQYTLLGHSMGGTIVSMFASVIGHIDPTLQPKSIILVDGLGPKHEEPEDAFLRLRTHISQRKSPISHRAMTPNIAKQKIARAYPFLDATSVALLFQENTIQIDNALKNTVWRWDAKHRLRSAIGFDLPRYLHTLSRIDIPCHIVFGKTSWYLELPDIPARIKAIPHVQTQSVLPSGHCPHLECPELLAHTIHSSLSTHKT